MRISDWSSDVCSSDLLVRPYDDGGVIAGQGTCGLEVIEQAGQLGAVLDAMLVCCGGGGLTAGCALAFEALSPQTKIFAVEPAGYDDTRLSLDAGRPPQHGNNKNPNCDALLAARPGGVPFAGK